MIAIREMQMKTIDKPLHTYWNGCDQKRTVTNVDEGYGEVGVFACCWWEYKRVQLVWKNLLFLKN